MKDIVLTYFEYMIMDAHTDVQTAGKQNVLRLEEALKTTPNK